MAKYLQLEDVEKIAREYPDSFFIPPEAERRSQKIGGLVRLHFLLEEPGEDEPRAERMWVEVTRECDASQPYEGTLTNEPAFIEDLQAGDQVTFEPCHIARTLIGKDDPRWVDSLELKALVSAMCLEEDECVRFLYREEPDREEDSGWRMFSGHETDEYNDDPDNIAVVDIGWMLDKDPSLLEPLKQGTGAVFERDEKDSPWQPVTDWSPEE